MNLASRVLFGVAVGYSEWADRQMACWRLLVGRAVGEYTSDGEIDSHNSDVCKQRSVET